MDEEELQLYREAHRNIPTLLLFFAVFSVIGWIYEILLEMAAFGSYIERGFLSGPYLPIYGFGLVFMLWGYSVTAVRWGEQLQQIRRRAVFLLVAVAATGLEYVTGTIVESVFGLKLWDYSRYPLNFKGRVCLMASVFFGLLGLFLLRAGFPWLLRQARRIPERWQWGLASGISVVILVDFIYTVVTAG